MNLNKVLYRIIIATLIFGSGCGSSNNNTNNTPTDPNQSSGGEVLYSKDIQPIFNTNCTVSSCHGNGAPSGLRLISYTDFAKGGASGKPYVTGDSANSLIISRLEGKISPIMPPGGTAMNANQIQKIKDWIDAGAKNN